MTFYSSLETTCNRCGLHLFGSNNQLLVDGLCYSCNINNSITQEELFKQYTPIPKPQTLSDVRRAVLNRMKNPVFDTTTSPKITSEDIFKDYYEPMEPGLKNTNIHPSLYEAAKRINKLMRNKKENK